MIKTIKRHQQKIFNRYIGILAILGIAFTLGIRVHSMFSFPKETDWNYKQLQKIDQSKNVFSFAVFADNKNSVKTFKKLINKVNNDNVLFAIDVGDLVYDGNKNKFKFFLDQVKSFKVPFLTVIGNHELKENGLANYYRIFGRPYYSFNIGNNFFIVLDDANEKNIDAWQMVWLKDQLEKSQNFKNRFVFMHVPLYDPRSPKEKHVFNISLKNSSQAKLLNDLFDKYKVTMLFCSHLHGYYQGRWQKTPYIITGGAGAELSGTDKKHYFYHYIKVVVNNGVVSYQIKKIKSPSFDWAIRMLNNAWLYIYAFFALHYLDIIILIIGLYLVGYVTIKKWNYWMRKLAKKHLATFPKDFPKIKK